MPDALSGFAGFAAATALVTLFLGGLAYVMRRLFVRRYKAGKRPRGLRPTSSLDQWIFAFMRRRGKWVVAAAWAAVAVGMAAPESFADGLGFAQLAAFLVTPLHAMALVVGWVDRRAGVTDSEIEAWLRGAPAPPPSGHR